MFDVKEGEMMYHLGGCLENDQGEPFGDVLPLGAPCLVLHVPTHTWHFIAEVLGPDGEIGWAYFNQLVTRK